MSSLKESSPRQKVRDRYKARRSQDNAI